MATLPEVDLAFGTFHLPVTGESDLSHQSDLFVAQRGIPTSKLGFETFWGELLHLLPFPSLPLSQVAACNSNRPAATSGDALAHSALPIFYRGKPRPEPLSQLPTASPTAFSSKPQRAGGWEREKEVGKTE